MKGKQPIVSVLFHNYYGDDAEWLDFFSSRMKLPYYLLYHGVSGTYYRLRQEPFLLTASKKPDGRMKQLVYRHSTNKGKDIGGKLVLLHAYI